MTEMILRDAVAKALREALDTDDRTFLMGEDIGAYGGPYAVTRGFLEDYGEDRIRDTPIAAVSYTHLTLPTILLV